VSEPTKRGYINILQEFSLPLLSGVVVAMVWANLDHASYEHVIHWMPIAGLEIFGHAVTHHWLVNDIFMVFFFGIAAKEITESFLPGGNLNPISKSINPLLATLGGVVGPVLVFFIGMSFLYGPGDDVETLRRGWGIPTATDIALAWLVARTVFGKGHPAINFLLLLAVADDAIGLGIIAIFYGDPDLPARPEFLLLIVLGMAIAYGMRRAELKSWIPYIAICGPLSWLGLSLAHLHPALALVFIVPFLPGPRRDIGLFSERDEIDRMGEELAQDLHMEHSPLHQFEHQMKLFVDFGLFFFSFTNAGVVFSSIGSMTWLILGSLVIGKTVGITLLGLIGMKIGFPLPARMGVRELVMAGFVAALGLTVALFVAGAAFTDPTLLGQAKMGALFSGFVGLAAILLGRSLGMNRGEVEEEGADEAAASSAS
jgi:NhaA family Na+:H+ antiporter